MKASWTVRGILLVGALGAAFVSGRATAAKEESQRLFELRTYITHEGKLEDLHTRFRDHTNRLFQKHGMELIGYWTPTDEPASQNTLIYVLAHKDLESAKKSWNGFRNDPEWQEAYRKSHENGPIVQKVESTYMVPTDYSPIK